MGERRKRKSLWDLEEETRHLSGGSGHNSWMEKDRHSSHDGGRYQEFSDSRIPIARKSRDRSGYPSWESIEEDDISLMNGSFKNTHDEKEIGSGNRYYRDMPPDYDDRDMHGYIHSHDYDQTHLQRYSGRGRSRSRSRSKTRGRSPTKSYSRGGGRERGRGFSRSRSRSYDDARGYSRSRSPMGNYRRQAYGWSDKRDSSEKPPQICREFTSGGCRRGSQCRFFHPDGTSRRDGDPIEHDRAEDWRSREDLSRIPKHSHRRGSGIESLNDISDPYHGEDQRLPNKNSTVVCKDFVRGNCRWGDTCRFSHHSASDGSFGQGTRNASFDKYGERPLCKFFAAGKCDRKNCRFSHENPNLNDQETQPGDITANASSSEMSKSKWWNGKTWDDSKRFSNPQKSIGWGDAGTSSAGTGDANGEQNIQGQNLENNEKILGKSEHTSSPVNKEQQLPLTDKSSHYVGGSYPTESVSKQNKANNQETQSPWLQSQVGVTDISGHGGLQESQNIFSEPPKQNLYPATQEQLCRTTETKVMSSAGSDGLRDMKETSYLSNQQLFSRQSLDLNSGSMFQGNSSTSNQIDGLQNTLFPNPSIGFSTDLNVAPEAQVHTVDHLNMQTHNNQKTVTSQELLEANVPRILTDLLTSKHSAQLINSLVNTERQFSPVKNPISLPQPNASLDVSSSRRMVPPFSDNSGCANLGNTSNAQGYPGAVSLDLLSSMGIGKHGAEQVNTEFGNQYSAQAMVQNMELEHSHPIPVFDMEVEKSPMPTQVGLTNSELAEGSKVIDEGIKDAQEDKQAGLLDGHTKVQEGGSGNKDDKGARLFKNSLVEFVKEILKPKWKEGKMSREVHKEVVKKVVDKISSSIQPEHVPKTHDKVDQYLSHSKPKITKLVQAYVDRCQKAES
ncbi:zinc finger CCCH domain-containing protein 55-like [Andrographis paniculata]|uniref:zinc finger CCCH domain-containing protein 55-like n=1 Tax=Andrographis paniculata TaxID=175694 RepID=UPI0021E72CBF|nr:zinc finger CCCH domain-containing protein 55-like [Andrographis paniculata]XP_051139433.1 zinc finger CCCH domain-containing protein 55-like [Andrographis paniculata]XP_051139434.1 zinc finger CCCH domain-containing protein 55-like [Andrographis paniculata]XP_051139435.1 zinc finger CCCH domain-containing protein 55-like [Andrographis paniculata]